MNDSHATSPRRPLLGAFVITATFLVVELVVALLVNSLALLADAGHMLGDAAALAMALAASFLSSKKGDRARSYGYGRVEVLVAFLNALLLLAIAGVTVWQAVARVRSPEPVLAGGMLAAAGAGLAANVACALILMGQARRNINVRAAFLHVAGDALGSIGVLAAAALILLGGWTIADPVASLFISGLIIVGGARLLLQSWHILMEGAPPGFSEEGARRALSAIDGVVSTHDIHVWSITSGTAAATAHLVVRSGVDAARVRREAALVFAREWRIEHTTIQVEGEEEAALCDHAECCAIGRGERVEPVAAPSTVASTTTSTTTSTLGRNNRGV